MFRVEWIKMGYYLDMPLSEFQDAVLQGDIILPQSWIVLIGPPCAGFLLSGDIVMPKRVRITEWKEEEGTVYSYQCQGLFYGFSFKPHQHKEFKDDIVNGLYVPYPEEMKGWYWKSTGRVFYGYLKG